MGKNEKHRDPDKPTDARQGDNWDPGAFDPEHRLVLSVVPGAGTEEKVEQLVGDFQGRTGGRIRNGMTSDESPADKTALFEAHGVEHVPPRTGRPGRRKKAVKRPPKTLKDATVHKERENGRVVKVTTRVVCGTPRAVVAAWALSLVGKVVNTVFIERHNGGDRNRNRRKVRKTCRFSKDGQVHEAMTSCTLYGDNFRWSVRTLRVKVGGREDRQRTPALAAGLTDHLGTTKEWVTDPAPSRLKDG